MTPEQLQTLKAAILADPVLAAFPNNSDGAWAIALAMNTVAVPTFTVWKTSVSINEVGSSFSGTELANLSAGNQSRLQTIAQYLAEGVNPSLIDVRSMFDDIFSGAGGTNTRAKLLIMWKRKARRVEALLKASGTGSDASPATLGFEGTVSYQDIEVARSS